MASLNVNETSDLWENMRPLVCHDQTPRTGWFQQQTFISSQLWARGGQHQDVSGFGFSRGGLLLPVSLVGLGMHTLGLVSLPQSLRIRTAPYDLI